MNEQKNNQADCIVMKLRVFTAFMGNFEVLISLITAFLSVAGLAIIDFSKDNNVKQ